MPRTAFARSLSLVAPLAFVATTGLLPPRALAQSADVLGITSVSLDPPTLHALGVQMLISGDQNRNARVTVRYRPAGSTEWREGPPLFRVFPETVTQPVPEQFAGSVFDLIPDTLYKIELHATDPDGPVDELRTLTGRTRPVPQANPASPTTINVASAAAFRSALASAAPGHVIVLADGIYLGTFFELRRSGTAKNPIVIRGESTAGVVLDGQGCSNCNVLEVYGSYVHVENLTIRNAFRAFRFQGTGTRNNVARRLQISNVIHGIAQGTNQRDFYLCDNVIEGRLSWPWVFDANASTHWDDRGVAVHGDGHVVCHNRISGFGDAMITMKTLARSIDFYGNDILDSFDGTELDFAGGNVRAIHNRWTNVAAGVSLQPVYGGPAYILRNVLLNVVDEQIKLKSLGGVEEPSGALIYHNTFVSPDLALNLQTPITGHNFLVMNNLFVGPRTLVGRVVDWTAGIDRGDFDFNGYFPDGGFWLGKLDGVNQLFPNFAALQASGVFETGGTLLTEPVFAGGFVGPADGTVLHDPADFTLASASNAIDRGALIPGINHRFSGAAPDLGAFEAGCPTPTYGPRPLGSEHLVAAVDCAAPLAPGNQAPVVNAGPDQIITLPGSAMLTGGATDDGQPVPPGTLTTTWTQVSGPGAVTFSDANALSTAVSFSASGAYNLRLTASDGAIAVSDDVTITANQAPAANAGADQTITLPSSATLAGTASDDGQPSPPGTLTSTWSKVSGPGTVTFGNAGALNTPASFSAKGVYVLRLTVADGVIPVRDDVAITVNPAPIGTGLTGEYYNDPGTGGHFVTLARTRIDPTVSFNWGSGSPGTDVQADNFSVRWTGQVLAPVTGNYIFSTVSNDGVRLWVNGQLVIDNWTDHAQTTDTSVPVALVVGVKYAIKMEFYDHADKAVAKLRWAYPGRSTHVIPRLGLFP